MKCEHYPEIQGNASDMACPQLTECVREISGCGDNFRVNEIHSIGCCFRWVSELVGILKILPMMFMCVPKFWNYDQGQGILWRSWAKPNLQLL
jgi:hypothetical protein